MRILRIALLAGGVWLMWYGADLLFAMNTTDLISVAPWFIGGILLHDIVFGPLAAALGLAGRHLLPPHRWAPVACGAVCTVTLLLIAVPVIGREHAVPGNSSILDRPYPWVTTGAVILVWVLVAADLTLTRHRIDAVIRRITAAYRR